MSDHIVVDVEIAKTVEEVGGWAHTELMGVGVAVVYEYRTDRFRVYGPGDVEALRERILRAERITGFNIIDFDYPVIFGLPRSYALPTALEREGKSNDILQRIWGALGGHRGGWSLESVGLGTLGCAKSGEGAVAPLLFQSGHWARLVDYCIEDVRLTRDLGAFIDRYGFVVNRDEYVLRLRP